ncbi:hypothetical protein I3843_08G149000 [Carya illinoinensis]|nr:hypothetical protein I3843_08G149000 [Carya illinoinensis]
MGSGSKHLSHGINENQYRELVISIEEMCCIYRILVNLLKLNKEAYTPQVISIGHFHHVSKSLEPMKKLKLKYLKRFLQRIDFNVEILVNAIKLLDNFVKLILVDGCFLIEFFKNFSSIEEKQVIPVNNALSSAMMDDLLLLENQLPLFVLEILFSLAYAPHDCKHPSFIALAIDVFDSLNIKNLPQNLEVDVKHFVDLARAFLLPSSRRLVPRNESNLARANHLYTETQLYKALVKFKLHKAGVKFKVSSSKCLLDLKFTNRTLKIPSMNLNNSIEAIYRNIIAFEQCHYPCDSHFTNYIVLLNFLINTTEDMDLLITKGIIINWLGSNDAVVSFINNLDTNVLYDKRDVAYCQLFQDLNAFYEDPKHIWKATFKQDYFSTPSKIASTAAAVILLLLTLGQFICSIIQVVKM